jgi:hypothetical protein
MTTLVLMSVACAAWVYLLAGRGGFWRAAQRDDAPAAPAADARFPSVAAVLPARVRPTSSVQASSRCWRRIAARFGDRRRRSQFERHGGRLPAHRRSRGAGPITVVAAPHLPADGRATLGARAWHPARGVAARSPDYLLLTDADIWHAADSVSALVARADRDLVLNSLMAKLLRNLAERASIPAFVFLQMLYPFAWVNRRRPQPRRPPADACSCAGRRCGKRAESMPYAAS